MNTRDKRQQELEGMSCIQLVDVFEAVFTEGSVIGFPLKEYAMNAILEKEFNGTVPVPIAKPKRQLAAI